MLDKMRKTKDFDRRFLLVGMMECFKGIIKINLGQLQLTLNKIFSNLIKNPKYRLDLLRDKN